MAAGSLETERKRPKATGRTARGGGAGAAEPQVGAAGATVSSTTSSTPAAAAPTAAPTSAVGVLVSILRAFLYVRHGLLAIAIQISNLVSLLIVSFVVTRAVVALLFHQQKQEMKENFCTTIPTLLIFLHD